MQERAPKTPSTSRLPFLGLALLLALLAAALGGTSFQRRVDAFQPLGFDYEAEKGSWRVTRVEAPETRLVAGDRIVREDEAGGSRQDFERRLRAQEETRLLVARDGLLELLVYERPGLDVDVAYLVLVGIGIIYLLIGLYTALKDDRLPARLFYFWCLLSAALYIMSPVLPPRDVLDEILGGVEQIARTLLPALTLHLFLVFPAPLGRSRAARFALPGLYLPAALILTFHADQIFGAKIFGQASVATVTWVLRVELWLLVLFSLLAALIVLARLAARPNWERRRQLHWIAIGMLGGYVPFLLLHVIPVSLSLYWPDWTTLVSVVPLALVPLGFAYAILKYKLWDIGVILRDTIAYSLTVLIGLAGFALIHMAIQRGLTPEMAVARNFLTFATGLVIAGVLVPTKGVISSRIESWQYRRSFPHRQALGRLGAELLYERDLARLCTSLVDRLADGLMAYTNLYLVHGGDRFSPVVPSDELPAEIGPDDLSPELWGHDVTSLSPVRLPGPAPSASERLFAAGFRYAFPLLVREHRVAILVVSYKFDDEPLNSEDLELTRGLLNQASLAIENAHLLDELHRRLDEVGRLEEHNKGIIESSPVGLVVLDAEDCVVTANPAFAAIVEEDAGTLAGRRLEEVFPVRPLPRPEDGLTEVSYGELSGRERYLQVSVARYESDEPLRILTVQDTSDLVAMELALKEKERLASLGLLAAGVAHEVNTPLTGISSYAQLLLSDVDESDPHHAVLKKLERQTFRAAQIVNNLLEFSRNRHHELSPVDLAAVIKECVAALDERLRESAVEVDWVPPEEKLRVLGHEGELNQVFTNLMVNAIDAMSSADERRLTLRLERREEEIFVRISDTGPGIPPERLERIFQPFFSSKAGKGGTGLGLAITHNIVRRHRGAIRVESHHGDRGCTFSVELPRHQVP